MNISESNYKILFSMTDDNSFRLNKQFLLFGEVRCASRKIHERKRLMLVPHFNSFGFLFFSDSRDGFRRKGGTARNL